MRTVINDRGISGDPPDALYFAHLRASYPRIYVKAPLNDIQSMNIYMSTVQLVGDNQ